jgi:protein-S-isoprenylcysteine O-methyltransferase Ste14
VSFAAHGEALFRNRGLILACIACLALALSQPSSESLRAALVPLTAGVCLRSWAFIYLGTGGRTRDPSSPQRRTVGGPYRWLAHPVYASNVVISWSLLFAASPGLYLSLVFLGGVVALYCVLGIRESQQLRGLEGTRKEPMLSLSELARSERSTWIQLAAFFFVLALKV